MLNGLLLLGTTVFSFVSISAAKAQINRDAGK